MSTYTARHSVQDMIRRRMEKNRKIKEKMAGRIDPKTYIMETIERFNKENAKSKNTVASFYLINDLKRSIEKDLTKVDASLESVELIWADGNEDEDVDKLRLDSIRVRFSPFYAERTGNDQDLNIDLSDIFFKVLAEAGVSKN